MLGAHPRAGVALEDSATGVAAARRVANENLHATD
jgi:beta-phosphoglucomutase-like phosphatase (HAD superfamily)